MASSLLSLLNGGGAPATPSQQRTTASTASPVPATTIDQLFARLNTGSAGLPASPSSGTPHSPAAIPLPPSQSSSPFGGPSQNVQHLLSHLQTPTPNAPSRSSQLLGLLSTGGQPDSSLDYLPHSTGTPAPLGVIGTPSPIGAGSSGSPPMKEERAQNLLAALLRGGASNISLIDTPSAPLPPTHQQPLIHHKSPSPNAIPPTVAPAADDLPPPRIKSPEPAPIPLPTLKTETPSVAASPLAEETKGVTPAPQKPLFSFISPFDAFDEPSARPKAAPATPSPASGLTVGNGKKATSGKKEKVKGKKAAAGTQSAASNKGSETDTRSISGMSNVSHSDKGKGKQNAGPPTPKIGGKSTAVPTRAKEEKPVVTAAPAPKKNNPVEPSTPSQNASVGKASTVAEISSPSSTPTGKKPPSLSISYPAFSFRDTRKKQNTPQAYQGNSLAIDVSQPGQGGIVHDMQGIVDRKISLVQTDTLAVGPVNEGKTVAVGGRLVAYALSKQGRIRILDQDTGVNALIEFPVDLNGKAQKVWDLAVSADHYCTAVSVNGWIAVWQIKMRIGHGGVDGESKIDCDLIATHQTEKFGHAWKSLYHSKRNGPWIGTDDVVRYFILHQGQSGLDSVVQHKGSPAGLVDFALRTQLEVVLLSKDGKIHVNDMSGSLLHEAEVPPSLSRQGVELPCSSLDVLGDYLIIGYGRGRVWKFVRISALQSSGRDDDALDISIEGDSSLPSSIGMGVSGIDEAAGLVYLSCFSRASLFAFSVQAAQHQGWSVRYLETPSEAIGSLAVGESSTGVDSELFMKNPRGFNQITFGAGFIKALAHRAQAHSSATQPRPSKAERRESATKELASDAVIPAVEVAQAGSQQEGDVPIPATNGPSQEIKVEEAAMHTEEPTLQQVNANIEEQVKQEPIEDIKPDVSSAPASSPAAASKNVAPSPPPKMYAGVSEAQLQEMEDRLCLRLDRRISDSLKASHSAQLAEIAKVQAAGQAADTERQETVLRLVSEALNRDVKGALSEIVQREIKTSLLPVVVETIKTQVAQVSGPELVSVVKNNIQDTVMTEVERMLVPHLAKTFTSALTPIVERNVKASIERDFMPKFLKSVQATNATVLQQVQQEWQSLRSAHLDLLKAPKEADPTITRLLAQVDALQQQIKTMGEDVAIIKARPPPPSPVAIPPVPLLHPAHAHPSAHLNGGFPSGFAPVAHYVASPPVRPELPVASPAPAPLPVEDAEEAFLSAFSTLGDEGLVDFVMKRQAQTAYYLPNPAAGNGKGPLSQAVLLTMIHKLSRCLEGKSPLSPVFQSCLGWVFRAAYLIDPQDSSIGAYLPQIKTALNQQYRTIVGSFAQIASNDPNLQQAKNAAANTMEQVIRRLG